MTITGPDASRHQGTVNWPKVKGAGHTFAIIKATDGISYRHIAWFRTHFPQVKAAGLVPGAYHFLTVHDGAAQARYFVGEVNRAGGFAGVLAVVDVERNFDGTSPSIATVKAFAAEFQRLTIGHPLIIYTGRWFWVGVLGDPAGAQLGALWHSEYEPTAAEVADGPEGAIYGGWSDWSLWQFTSTGVCPGISGPCDLNVFNGDRAALDALAGVTAPVVPPPVPNEEMIEMMMVQSKESGAVLLVTGGASLLIVNMTELTAHKAAGIPLLAVGGDQFRRYEALRADNG